MDFQQELNVDGLQADPVLNFPLEIRHDPGLEGVAAIIRSAYARVYSNSGKNGETTEQQQHILP
ncbi:hypothetical protein H4219_005386, partial [Mycoemilia scoparia]